MLSAELWIWQRKAEQSPRCLPASLALEPLVMPKLLLISHFLAHTSSSSSVSGRIFFFIQLDATMQRVEPCCLSQLLHIGSFYVIRVHLRTYAINSLNSILQQTFLPSLNNNSQTLTAKIELPYKKQNKHLFNVLFSRTNQVGLHQKDKPLWIFLKQRC